MHFVGRLQRIYIKHTIEKVFMTYFRYMTIFTRLNDFPIQFGANFALNCAVH